MIDLVGRDLLVKCLWSNKSQEGDPQPDDNANARFHQSTDVLPSFVVSDSITELLRVHARKLIAEALDAEVAAVIAELKTSGAGVVRNGYLPERRIMCAIGDVEVKVPRIRSKDGQPVTFLSTLVPKYLRRSKSILA